MAESQNNKRIAKNTLLLYIRMLLTMAVSLYTVRVVLQTLGAQDYGIFNVVGGVVTMFAFLSNTMASASQRFFSIEIGRNDMKQLKKTFSITVTIYIIIALAIIGLGETIGLWFLNNKMNIPMDRMEAANWIYQFSILSFVLTVLTIPYNANIIAREDMKTFAYISIFEVTVKLIIVFLLTHFSYDKLKLYAILMFTATLMVTSTYRWVCRKKFEESKFSIYWNKKLFITLISYSGWNLFGAIAGVMNNQGINILLNLFFGPSINAARGVANQVNYAINQFVINFLTAARPQIIKYYSIGDTKAMIKLVFQSSKYSYLLLMMMSMPFLLETKYIMTLWLTTIPEYVIMFTRLMIINTLIDSLSYPLMTAAQATGEIKRYQTIVGSLMLLNVPIAYILFKFNYPPEATLYTAICISLFCLAIRLTLLQSMIQLSIVDFTKVVLIKIIVISILSYSVPIFLINNIGIGLGRFLLTTFTAIIISIGTTLYFGISSDERKKLYLFIQSKILRLRNQPITGTTN